MTEEVQIRGIATCSRTFACHHGLVLPRPRGRLELGAEFARGGFGVLRPVPRVDGVAPGRAIVAKLFSPGALLATSGSQILTARVAELHRVLESRRRSDDWCTALLALPFCLASAQSSDGIGLVALMLDMRALGYRPSPFGQLEETAAHLTRPTHERIDLTLRYAERAALCEIGSSQSQKRSVWLPGAGRPHSALSDQEHGSGATIALGSGGRLMRRESNNADEQAGLELHRYRSAGANQQSAARGGTAVGVATRSSAGRHAGASLVVNPIASWIAHRRGKH